MVQINKCTPTLMRKVKERKCLFLCGDARH